MMLPDANLLVAFTWKNHQHKAEAESFFTRASPGTSERAKSNFLRVDQLFAAADRLVAQDLPPLTEVEVETEIQAARSPRRTSEASRR
jgi:predicted nucleic acid-binding protein